MDVTLEDSPEFVGRNRRGYTQWTEHLRTPRVSGEEQTGIYTVDGTLEDSPEFVGRNRRGYTQWTEHLRTHTELVGRNRRGYIHSGRNT